MEAIVAVVIFVLMFALIILDRIPRHWITLGCAAATLLIVFGICMRSPAAITETLNIRSIFTGGFWISAGESSSSGINWETIIFVAGMMVMVEGMAKAGFFRWLCLTIAKAVKYKILPILVTFMVMSAVLAMFIDSITVILFLAAVTVELSQLLKFDPVPMVLAEIFCANLGGSATMCGDPPNIIVGTALGYSFADFITNTGVIAGVALVFSVVFYTLAYRRELTASAAAAGGLTVHYPEPGEAITNKKDFALSCVIFLCAVVLLVSHAQTHLTVAFIGVAITALTLLCFARDAKEILRGVDYQTLLFFIGLFVVVGGLEQTGVLVMIAEFIGRLCGGNLLVMIYVVMWISAVASSVVDNIPFAATMVPVIKTLAATTGADLSTLAWGLSVGTDIGGSATPIGASANVVGTSVVSKAGHPVSWGRYCKTAIPATVMVLAIAMIIIKVRYF